MTHDPVDRIVLTPRWSGNHESDFYPWLRGELAARASSVAIQTVALHSPDAPDVALTSAAVQAALDEVENRSNTIAMGHSVGCQAVLRALAAGPSSSPVAATLLVAGWWHVDEPWPDIEPWIHEPFDIENAKAHAGRIVVLVSDDDPFTSDTLGTARTFAERLDAEIRLVPGAKHFNAEKEPAVLQALLDLLAS